MSMKDKDDKASKPSTKPNEIVRGDVVDHLKIVDKETNKDILNKRG